MRKDKKLGIGEHDQLANCSGGVLGFWGGVGSMGALFLLALGSQR